MRLVLAMIARNEGGEDRYLNRVLTTMRPWVDEVCFLDDGSTDDTVAIAQNHGCQIRHRDAEPMWGNESAARQELWEWAAEVAGDGWVLFGDADMELTADPRPLTESLYLNTWCFRLYDMWSDHQYRTDGMWKGHTAARPWMVRPNAVPEGWEARWNPRGLHCGHLPENWPMASGEAPREMAWLHWSYATPDHRQKKYDQYLSRRDVLTPSELEHAESILDG